MIKNARDIISVIDTKEGKKLVANIPSQGNKPHPGEEQMFDHPNMVHLGVWTYWFK